MLSAAVISAINQNFLANIYFALSNISVWEIFDIVIVAVAIYIVILFVKQTKSYFVLIVSIALLLLAFISQNLNLSLTRAIVQPISTLTFIIIAIVLQKEIRHFFRWVVVGRKHIFNPFTVFNKNKTNKSSITEIADALSFMAEKRIGALIVFSQQQDLEDLLSGGQTLNGSITKEILLSIFDPSSPGHDGAVVIENNSIKQFGVHLPLARDYRHYRRSGTRHRAAAGISEDTDAVTFVVSEERGIISVFRGGEYKELTSTDQLIEELAKLIKEEDKNNNNFWTYFFARNFKSKMGSLVLACMFWLVLLVQTGIVKQELVIPLSFQLLPSNYEITKGGTEKITVTIQGKNNDLNSFDTTKIQTKIDTKGLTPGQHEIAILPSMITVPSFITIKDIEPNKINITVLDKKIEKQQEQVETNQ